MRSLRFLLLVGLISSASVLWSAELPSKGIERPKIYTGLTDGGFPGGPGASVGDGFFLLLGFAAAYSYVVKNRKRD